MHTDCTSSGIAANAAPRRYGNRLVTNAKQQFWKTITILHNRHYGLAHESSAHIKTTGIDDIPAVHYLVGEAGYPNYGDELIAREWLKYLAQIDPETPVVLDCMCSGPAAALMYGVHPRIMAVDTIARLAQNNYLDLLREQGKQEGEIPAAVIAERVRAQLDDVGQAPRYAGGIQLFTEHIKDCHVIGGGYMNSDWTDGLARLAGAQWAQQHGVPAVVSGVGLEPLSHEDAAYARDVALGITAFSCRDQQSVTAVDPKHEVVTLVPDDCFVNALEGVYVEDAASLPDTMLCVQSDFIDDKQALLRHVIAVFERWGVPESARIGVVECIPRDSIDTMDMLREHGYEPQLFPLQHLIDFGFPARPGQRWLSTRYHPHLLAAAHGCAGSYIVVKPGYYDVKHQAVVRMGSRWTQTIIDQEEIPEPGPGFADPDVRYQYRDRVRAQVVPVYGKPPAVRPR